MAVGKIIKGSHFGAAIRYLVGEGNEPREKELPFTKHEGFAPGYEEGKRARLLLSNMSGENAKECTDEFNRMELLRGGKKREEGTQGKKLKELKDPMRHLTFSLKDGETLSTAQWQEVAEKILDKTGFKDAPFLVIQHRDRNHEHIHIVTSRITYGGETVSDSFEKDRLRTIAREIEKEYGLTETPQRAEKKSRTRADKELKERTGEPTMREQIQNQIDELTKQKRSAAELAEELRRGGVFFKPNIQKSGKVVGVSFAKADRDGKVWAFKGSELGQGYKWSELAKKIDYQPERDKQAFVEAKAEAERAERGEIKQPTPSVIAKQPAPAAETQTQTQDKYQQEKSEKFDLSSAQQKQAKLAGEILQITRKSLEKQGIAPSAELWKSFENDVTTKLANEKANKNQENTLKILQRTSPEAKTVSFADKSKLEAMHTLLHLAADEMRDRMIKDTLAVYAKQTGAERGELTKSASPPTGKPQGKVREFATRAEKETMIAELVSRLDKEARHWKGEGLNYQEQKRLWKFYRERGESPPTEKQTARLDKLQEGFAGALPRPQTMLSANLFVLDNSDETTRTGLMRQQIEGVQKLLALDEERRQQSYLKQENQRTTDAITNSYQQGERDYFEQMSQAQERNLIPNYAGYEQIQEGIAQMQTSDALQKAIGESLKEQGIELDQRAARILGAMIDNLANQQPTKEETDKVQAIAERTGGSYYIENKLQAVTTIYAYSREEERDEFSSELAASAEEKAEKARATEMKEQKQEKSIERENPRHEDYSRGRSM